MTRSPGFGFAIAAALLASGVLIALTQGRFPVALADIARLAWAGLTGSPADVLPDVETVVLRIRGPRVVAAVLIPEPVARCPAVRHKARVARKPRREKSNKNPRLTGREGLAR